MTPIRSLVAALLLAASAPAAAEFHLMSIREVYVGPAADANAQYVELQMYSAGQGLVQGHDLTFYDAAGALLGTLTLPNNVAEDSSQAFILIATAEAETRFGINADFTMAPLLAPAGGKVCFEDVDCFSWGTFAGSATTPSPSGTPFNAAGGLTPDSAARRDISGGVNATRLEAADDTDDSAADFDFAVAADPDSNQTPPPGDPDEDCGYQGCAGGGGGGGYGGYGGGGAQSLIASLLLLLAAGIRRR